MLMLMTDLWAVGCIYAEMLSLRPIFKAEEAKIDTKKQLPFQRDQMGKICEILGPVKRESPSSSSISLFLQSTFGNVYPQTSLLGQSILEPRFSRIYPRQMQNNG